MDNRYTDIDVTDPNGNRRTVRSYMGTTNDLSGRPTKWIRYELDDKTTLRRKGSAAFEDNRGAIYTEVG